MKRNEFIVAKIFCKENEFLMERLVGRSYVIGSVDAGFNGINFKDGWTKVEEPLSFETLTCFENLTFM